MENKPEYTPSTVRQALAWLDKLNISYHYVPEAHLWEFIYDGLYLLLLNDCKDNEFGIYAPMLITETDDEEICKIVCDVTFPMCEKEFSPDCNIGYDGNGMCHIAQGWFIESKRPHLTKKTFVEKLNEMHDYQLKLHFALQLTYEGMFNPPREVMEEIFKNLNNEESDE